MLGSPVPLLEMRKVLTFWNRKIKSDMLRSNINISDIKTQKENTINLINGMSFWIANIHWVLMCASSLVSTLKSTSLNFKTTLSVDMFTMPTGTRTKAQTKRKLPKFTWLVSFREHNPRWSGSSTWALNQDTVPEPSILVLQGPKGTTTTCSSLFAELNRKSIWDY